VTASVTGTTCESAADLAKRICAALKSERISRAVRGAKQRKETP
jgi:hypothetical protein